jgi:hypothetical protein
MKSTGLKAVLLCHADAKGQKRYSSYSLSLSISAPRWGEWSASSSGSGIILPLTLIAYMAVAGQLYVSLHFNNNMSPV